MKIFRTLLLFLIGLGLIVASVIYGFFAPVRVMSNIDSYETEIKERVAENIGLAGYPDPEGRFEKERIFISVDGIAHLARLGWTLLNQVSIILLVSGSLVTISAFSLVFERTGQNKSTHATG